jgi:predicted O-methyltransferase YrrM
MILLARRLGNEGLFRRLGRPSLSELVSNGIGVSLSPSTLIAEITTGSPVPSTSELEIEFEALSAELRRRYDVRLGTMNYPKHWAVADRSSLLLYLLVRTLHPRTVLETGIANGQSSFFLLRALAKNGAGNLVSVDVSSDTGGLVDESERRDWRVCILDRHRKRAQLRDLVRSVPPIDLFLHDSEHTYSSQMFEYTLVSERLARGGVLVTDDADGSYAFLDFCKRGGRTGMLLVDRDKVLGLCQIA